MSQQIQYYPNSGEESCYPLFLRTQQLFGSGPLFCDFQSTDLSNVFVLRNALTHIFLFQFIIKWTVATVRCSTKLHLPPFLKKSPLHLFILNHTNSRSFLHHRRVQNISHRQRHSLIMLMPTTPPPSPQSVFSSSVTKASQFPCNLFATEINYEASSAVPIRYFRAELYFENGTIQNEISVLRDVSYSRT